MSEPQDNEVETIALRTNSYSDGIRNPDDANDSNEKTQTPELEGSDEHQIHYDMASPVEAEKPVEETVEETVLRERVQTVFEREDKGKEKAIDKGSTTSWSDAAKPLEGESVDTRAHTHGEVERSSSSTSPRHMSNADFGNNTRPDRMNTHITLTDEQQAMPWVRENAMDENGQIRFKQIERLAQLEKSTEKMNAMFAVGIKIIGMMVFVLLTITIGLTFFFCVRTFEEFPMVKNGVMTTNDGGSMSKMQVLTHKVPLYVLPVLDKKDLEQIQMISLTLEDLAINPASQFYQTDEGNQTTEFGFNVASYSKINTTFAVFHDHARNQLSIKNGAVHFRFHDNYFFMGEYRVCASNITCANTELDGVNVTALRETAVNEIIKIAVDIDIDVFKGRRRSRRQLSVIEFAATIDELQHDSCMPESEKQGVLRCLGVENDDTCYLSQQCSDDIHVVMSNCGKPTRFDGVVLCSGSQSSLIEALFDC